MLLVIVLVVKTTNAVSVPRHVQLHVVTESVRTRVLDVQVVHSLLEHAQEHLQYNVVFQNQSHHHLEAITLDSTPSKPSMLVTSLQRISVGSLDVKVVLLVLLLHTLR